MIVEAEGTRFLYVSPGVPFHDFVNTENFRGTHDLVSGNDTRLAFFATFLQPDKLNQPYWLVWQKAVDLIRLDCSIKENMYTDADFKSAFRTVFEKTSCCSCGATVDALIVDAGDIYLGAPNLMQEKIKKLNSLACPKCAGSLRRLVAKIIRTHD